MNQVLLTYITLGWTLIQCLVVQGYREHKVHNIVLYPDKHSWCKTTTIKQVISYPGCTSVEIDNNVCVGACFSYSIPHTEPSDPGEVIVPYCDSCQPSETTWHQITLQCNKNDADAPSQLIKNVQIIHNCSCTSCEKDSVRLTQHQDNSDDLLLQQNVDSELLHALQNRNESSNYKHLDGNHWKKMHSFLNQKLVPLLKNIQTDNTDSDKEQLMELFNMIADPSKHNVKAKDIIDFIESLQNNKTEIDAQRLAESLLKFKHYSSAEMEMLQQENSTSVDDNPVQDIQSSVDNNNLANSEEDIAPVPPKSPIDLWLQNSERQSSATSMDLNERETQKEQIQAPDDSVVPSGERNPVIEHSGTEEIHHQHHLHSHAHNHLHQHPHQHHVNENVLSHGHLTRGPHGALVIEPDRIHEKLDVHAHELKPNHAGTLLSYHSHSDEGKSRK